MNDNPMRRVLGFGPSTDATGSPSRERPNDERPDPNFDPDKPLGPAHDPDQPSESVRDPAADPKPSVARMQAYTEHIGIEGVFADATDEFFPPSTGHAGYFDWVTANPAGLDLDTWPRVRPEARAHPFVGADGEEYALEPPEKFVLLTGTDEQVRQLLRRRTADAVTERVDRIARPVYTDVTALSDGTVAVDFSFDILTGKQLWAERWGGRLPNVDAIKQHYADRPWILEPALEMANRIGTIHKSGIVFDADGQVWEFVFRLHRLPKTIEEPIALIEWVRHRCLEIAPHLPADLISAFTNFGGAEDGVALLIPVISCEPLHAPAQDRGAEPEPMDVRAVLNLLETIHREYSARYGERRERRPDRASPYVGHLPEGVTVGGQYEITQWDYENAPSLAEPLDPPEIPQETLDRWDLNRWAALNDASNQ